MSDRYLYFRQYLCLFYFYFKFKANKSQDPEPMIIFLTDGDATVGETDAQKIKEAVKTANNDKTAIFSLAFGNNF